MLRSGHRRSISLFLTVGPVAGIIFGVGIVGFSQALNFVGHALSGHLSMPGLPWAYAVAAGSVFGAVAGALAARRAIDATITVPIGPNREEFISNLVVQFRSIGYQLDPAATSSSLHFSGSAPHDHMRVIVDERSAVISGPAYRASTLLRYLEVRGKAARSMNGPYRD